MNHRSINALVALGSALVLLGAGAGPAGASRLKELVDIEGHRSNAMTGFGIVVGLNGTGDDARSPVVRRSLAKMLKRLGVTVDAAEIKAKNVAAVVVTAELPAFARAGSRMDVLVSSIGSSKSLEGGTLIATPLKGANMETYALAQGPISTGGFLVQGGSGSQTRKNFVTVARMPGGAIIERDAPGLIPRGRIVLQLKQPDFTTATRIAAAIDKALGPGSARVRDPGAVTVLVTDKWRNHPVELVASLEALEATADAPARVVVDERTGTVVVGANVSLGPAAIASGGLEVEINETQEVSQPLAALSEAGKTVVTPKTEIKVKEKTDSLHMVAGAATVADVAAALNALGVKPRDLVAILQALKAAGALTAEIQLL
ncbi:MAG TPA: flagellar basal body P-ring protein FlgI [Kofleriaceae bacterium]|nr:flagellar basal body P-ring protein FlgI [Kofleriaceae bacterium]